MSEGSTTSRAEGPLSDIKVLDLTWVLSGPYAAMNLADLGAEVIKVERPPYGDVARTTGPYINGESTYFFSINRGKKSTILDLRKPEGRELFLRMVEKVDVVMENFTPGTMDRMGVGWDVMSARNPRLIYAATSGFGQTGPDRDKPALDVVVQGMGGIMSVTGEEGGRPVRPGVSIGDITAGLYTALGILAAIHERERSGRGQMIDISMLDCQIAILENAFARYFATGVPPKPIGTRHPLSTPFQAFPTADGYIVIALGFSIAEIWGVFCAVIGKPELIDDPRFDTPGHRTQNHAELEPILNEALIQRTTDEWLAELEAISLPCGPLNTIPQAAEHRQVKAREMLKEVESPRGNRLTISNTPLRLSRTPAAIRGGPPTVGQHTREVLANLLGMSDAEIDAEFSRGSVVEGKDRWGAGRPRGRSPGPRHDGTDVAAHPYRSRPAPASFRNDARATVDPFWFEHGLETDSSLSRIEPVHASHVIPALSIGYKNRSNRRLFPFPGGFPPTAS